MASGDRFDSIVLDEQYTLKVETEQDETLDETGVWVVSEVAKHWWLLDDGVPVAFLSTLFTVGGESRHGGCPLHLCDIEVRDGHRGKGHVRRLVRAVEQVEGHQMWTSGGFTPLGAQALSWLPVLPGETAGVKYNDMLFVRDWDGLKGAFPL